MYFCTHKLLVKNYGNPNFKHIEFDVFKSKAGLNAFVLSPTQWIEKTNAIGLVVKSGRYGGTFECVAGS